MRRTGGFLALATLAAGAALLLARCGGGSERKPNVVIIAIDTLRPDHLGLYGSARDTSPNLDRWAKEAVVFDNAQTAAPWTAPSLISVMTSLYPSVHGVARFPDPGAMNERVTTLAEVLEQHGYLTGAFTDGGYAKKQFGLGQGFDIYPLNRGDTPSEHASNLLEPDRLVPNIDRTLAWLERVEDEPFFLFFHTYQVHGPYRPPPQYVAMFRPGYDEAAEEARLKQVLERWQATNEIEPDGVRLVLQHIEHCLSPFAPELQALHEKMREYGIGSMDADRTQAWRDRYDGEIRYTDDELQRLLARFERPGLKENTLIVFVSDHGEAFGEHGLLGHGSALHEEALRVLLVLRAPGVAARRVPDVVSTLDVMPTLLELAGIPLDGLKLQGRSLAPFLRGAPLAPAPSFSHAISRKDLEGWLWSVRDGRWRYVWDEKEQAGRLFDLESDPQELSDVAAANPKVAERLLGLLRAQRDVDATFREQASGPVGPYVIDDELRKELKDLGYTADDKPLQSSERVALPPPVLGGR